MPDRRILGVFRLFLVERKSFGVSLHHGLDVLMIERSALQRVHRRNHRMVMCRIDRGGHREAGLLRKTLQSLIVLRVIGNQHPAIIFHGLPGGGILRKLSQIGLDHICLRSGVEKLLIAHRRFGFFRKDGN